MRASSEMNGVGVLFPTFPLRFTMIGSPQIAGSGEYWQIASGPGEMTRGFTELTTGDCCGRSRDEQGRRARRHSAEGERADTPMQGSSAQRIRIRRFQRIWQSARQEDARLFHPSSPVELHAQPARFGRGEQFQSEYRQRAVDPINRL